MRCCDLVLSAAQSGRLNRSRGQHDRHRISSENSHTTWTTERVVLLKTASTPACPARRSPKRSVFPVTPLSARSTASAYRAAGVQLFRGHAGARRREPPCPHPASGASSAVRIGARCRGRGKRGAVLAARPRARQVSLADRGRRHLRLHLLRQYHRRRHVLLCRPRPQGVPTIGSSALGALSLSGYGGSHISASRPSTRSIRGDRTISSHFGANLKASLEEGRPSFSGNALRGRLGHVVGRARLTDFA